MFELTARADRRHVYCGVCAHDWEDDGHRAPSPGHRAASPAAVSAGASANVSPTGDGRMPEAVPERWSSLDALVAATGIRRDELNTLASLGALNSFGTDRRGALWEAERVVRPTGDLFAFLDEDAAPIRVGADDGGTHGGRAGSPSRPQTTDDPTARTDGHRAPGTGHRVSSKADVSAEALAKADGRMTTADAGGSPLPPMTPMERIVADYRGSGVTIGPHPMALRRADLRLRGVMRSDELVRTRGGRRVRVAGAVITRQRPGTAKGMVFLTLEDEAGLANVIIRPDVFDRQRPLIMRAPFLVVEGVLQQLEGVTSVRAERVMGFAGDQPRTPSHDFR